MGLVASMFKTMWREVWLIVGLAVSRFKVPKWREAWKIVGLTAWRFQTMERRIRWVVFRK